MGDRSVPTTQLAKPGEDEYKWRKYGTKILKDTTLPRSYFKCTHPGCKANKIVEYHPSLVIRAIHFRGRHNHGKNNQTSTSTVLRGTIVVEDEDDDDDDEDFDTRSALSNERLIFEMKSDLDNPDDGYHWKKYGLKSVNKNPNQRSYYKCTHLGCEVRKQVERLADDPQILQLQYDKKHDHEIPPPSYRTQVRQRGTKRKRATQNTIIHPEPDQPLYLDLSAENTLLPDAVLNWSKDPKEFEAQLIPHPAYWNQSGNNISENAYGVEFVNNVPLMVGDDVLEQTGVLMSPQMMNADHNVNTTLGTLDGIGTVSEPYPEEITLQKKMEEFENILKSVPPANNGVEGSSGLNREGATTTEQLIVELVPTETVLPNAGPIINFDDLDPISTLPAYPPRYTHYDHLEPNETDLLPNPCATYFDDDLLGGCSIYSGKPLP